MDDREYRRAFYPAVDQRQALDDRQQHYYVPIYERPELAPYDVVRVLADAIDFSGGTSVQLLSCYRGSGKTSELLRLAEQLRSTGRSVVYLDIEDYFNTELPLELGAFPVALAATVRERLGAFLRRVDLEPTIGAAVPGGISAELKVSLREDASFIGRVRSQLESNRALFRRELHEFFQDAAGSCRRSRRPCSSSIRYTTTAAGPSASGRCVSRSSGPSRSCTTSCASRTCTSSTRCPSTSSRRSASARRC